MRGVALISLLVMLSACSYKAANNQDQQKRTVTPVAANVALATATNETSFDGSDDDGDEGDDTTPSDPPKPAQKGPWRGGPCSAVMEYADGAEVAFSKEEPHGDSEDAEVIVKLPRPYKEATVMRIESDEGSWNETSKLVSGLMAETSISRGRWKYLSQISALKMEPDTHWTGDLYSLIGLKEKLANCPY